MSGPPPASARDLLDWYDRHRRRLPWRALPGERPDPYRVWLSEIMLQQTTVAAVKAYFETFTTLWPTVADLASAPIEDVLARWAGLGYYARARNLHACARTVVERHGGRFPDEEAALRALPGVGPYTAAAIAAIAFGRPAVPVDGNVERVIARLLDIDQPLPAAKAAIGAAAGRMLPADRPGDFAQALMDLGATICTPRAPRCGLCPWMAPCLARRRGTAEVRPVKAARKPRPTRRAIAFLAMDEADRIWLGRRPPRGLLGGMAEVPSSPWDEGPPPELAEAIRAAPFAAGWRLAPGLVRHTFTHFHLELGVATARIAAVERRAGPGAGRWVAVDEWGSAGLPSVMVKVVRLGLPVLLDPAPDPA